MSRPAPSPSPVLAPLRVSAEAVINLVCFPYGGGGPSAFRPWARHLPRWVGLWAVHLGGREGRFDVRPESDLLVQVTEISQAVRMLPARPLVFYGHCMGADLAAHVAQDVFPSLQVPSALIVAARESPWARDAGGLLEKDPAELSDEELLGHLTGLGVIDHTILQMGDLREFVMPVLRADMALCQGPGFLRKKSISSTVYALFGRNDANAGAESVKGWGDLTDGASAVIGADGGHFFATRNHSVLSEIVVPALTHIAHQAGSWESV